MTIHINHNANITTGSSDAKIKTCAWTESMDYWLSSYWSSSCDNEFTFENGGPKDNGFVYCPYCGGILKESVK